MNNLINGLLDQDFIVSSYEDFLQHAQKKATGFLGVFTDIIDAAEPENDTDNIVFPTAATIRSKLNQIGMEDNTILSTQDGFITVNEFIQQFETQYALYYAGDIDSLSSAPISMTNSIGETVESNVQDVFDQIKDNIYSSMAEVAALKAAKYPAIADRISYFTTNLESSLDATNLNVALTLSYYKQKLLSDTSPYQLLSHLFQEQGVDELDADVNGYTLADFDVSKYSGGNPLGVISFSCVKDIARSAGKVVGSVCKGIWNACRVAGDWVWGKVKKYAVETLIDPYDVVDSGNSKAKYCFEGFQWQRRYDDAYYSDAAIDLTNSSLNMQDIMEAAQGSLLHWYLIKTVGGEIAIRPLSVDVVTEPGDPRLHIMWGGDILFKPYSLNSSIPGGSSMSEFMDNLSAMTDGLYLDASASERDLFKAFAFGAKATMEIMSAYAADLSGDTSFTWSLNSTVAPATIDNLEWLKLATGYRVMDGQTYFDYNVYAEASLKGLGAMLYSCVLMATANSNAGANRDDDTYFPFVQDTQGMSTGRFTIKTDSQNSNVALAIAGALIVIAVAVIAVVTGTIIVKKFAKKAFLKRTDFVGKMDNKMWSTDEPLTKSEARKYIRYRRKLEASNFLTSGVVTTTSAVDAISNSTSNVTTAVSSLLKGNDPTDDLTLASLSRLIKGV